MCCYCTTIFMLQSAISHFVFLHTCLRKARFPCRCPENRGMVSAIDGLLPTSPTRLRRPPSESRCITQPWPLVHSIRLAFMTTRYLSSQTYLASRTEPRITFRGKMARTITRTSIVDELPVTQSARRQIDKLSDTAVNGCASIISLDHSLIPQTRLCSHPSPLIRPLSSYWYHRRRQASNTLPLSPNASTSNEYKSSPWPVCDSLTSSLSCDS